MNNTITEISKSVKRKIGILKDRIKRKNKNIILEDLISDLISAGLVSELEEKHKTDKRYGFILKEKKSGDYSLDNIKIGYMETFKTREQDQIGKLCCFCKQRKSKDEFYKNKGRNDGLSSMCKKCYIIKSNSLTGIIRKIYKDQVRSSKRRKHTAPDYNQKWLTDWLLSKDEYRNIYHKWIESGMKSELRPSIDRINPLRPYTKDNIQLMTWGENSKKWKSIDLIVHKDHKNNKDLYKDNLDIALKKISMARAIYAEHTADAKSKGIEIEYTKEWFSYFLIKNDIFTGRFMETVKINSKELIKVKIERPDLSMPFSKTNIKIV